MEMQRLREGRSSTDDAGPLGILTVSNIRLPLKPEFMSKIGTSFGELITSLALNLQCIHILVYSVVRHVLNTTIVSSKRSQLELSLWTLL